MARQYHRMRFWNPSEKMPAIRSYVAVGPRRSDLVGSEPILATEMAVVRRRKAEAKPGHVGLPGGAVEWPRAEASLSRI